MKRKTLYSELPGHRPLDWDDYNYLIFAARDADGNTTTAEEAEYFVVIAPSCDPYSADDDVIVTKIETIRKALHVAAQLARETELDIHMSEYL